MDILCTPHVDTPHTAPLGDMESDGLLTHLPMDPPEGRSNHAIVTPSGLRRRVHPRNTWWNRGFDTISKSTVCP
jgi:hypothetical protein